MNFLPKQSRNQQVPSFVSDDAFSATRSRHPAIDYRDALLCRQLIHESFGNLLGSRRRRDVPSSSKSRTTFLPSIDRQRKDPLVSPAAH